MVPAYTIRASLSIIPAKYRRMRNPPIWALRKWWRTFSAARFKKARLADVRRIWRYRVYDPKAEDDYVVWYAWRLTKKVIEDAQFLKDVDDALQR